MTDEKYAKGTKAQTQVATKRALGILSEHKPDKVFVFSRKAWIDFPPTDQERVRKQHCTPLIKGMREPSWGEYTFGGHKTLACGFRHPQFSNGEALRIQVQEFLRLR